MHGICAENDYWTVTNREKLIKERPSWIPMAIEDADLRRKRRTFEAGGTLGVSSLHSAIQAQSGEWTDLFTPEDLTSLGEMGIVLHKEKSVMRRLKPEMTGAVLKPK